MKRIYEVVSWVLTKISFWIIIVYTLLVAIQVISRYVFNSPTTWTELVARYLFVWSLMLYMPVLYRHHGNAAFDLLLKRLPVVTLRYIEGVINLIVAATAGLLSVWGILFCLRMKSKYIVGINIDVKLPMNLVYAAIPVGSVLLLLMCIEEFMKNLEAIKKGGPEC